MVKDCIGEKRGKKRDVKRGEAKFGWRRRR